MEHDMDINTLTARDIARLLPPSWVYSFVDLSAALHYYHPEMFS